MTPASHAVRATLSLPPADLWTLHHVLRYRIESKRRSRETADAPRAEVVRAFEKVNAGDSWFTPRELRCMRGELRRYLDRTATSPSDRAAIERIVDRITDALARQGDQRRDLTPGRRRRPR